MKKTLGLAGTAIAAALFMTAAAAQEPIVARIGNCTMGDVVHEQIKIFKDELEKQSNGRIKGELFINCQLGNIARQIEGLQLGTQDYFTVPPGNAVGVEGRYAVIDAPGLFDSFEHAQRSITTPAFYDRYMQLGRDKGLTPVSLWESGSVSYLTLKPLRTIDDFKGLKFRVLATKLETALMARYGTTGVPIPFPEIVPSLITKIIDGARTAPLVMASAKMYSAAKYATVTDDTYIPIIAWVSNRFLEKLPADLRQIVMKVGRDVEARMPALAIADHQRGLKTLQENGVELIRLPPDQQAEWMRRARATSDEYLANEPTMKDLYGVLKEAAEKTRS